MSSTTFKGAGLVAFNLRQMSGPRLQAATRAAVKAMGEVGLDEVRANITRSDHSLKALARMGHPYARRHGSIRVHPQEPHVVHEQGGRMANSLEGKLVRRPGGRGGGARDLYRIGFDRSPPAYVRHVVQGTKVMLGRDVIAASVYNPEVRKRMLRAVVTVMGKEMRTQAGLRFGR